MDAYQPIALEKRPNSLVEAIGFDKVAAGLALKIDLVSVLYRFQQELGLSQAAFGRLVGIPQPRLSKLYKGKIAGTSTDKLLAAIAKLGGHVTVQVEPHPAPSHAGRVELEVCVPAERRRGRV